MVGGFAIPFHRLGVVLRPYLGLLYERGQGVPQDYVQAHMWLNLAASHEKISGAVEDRDKLASKMTPAQIAEAQKLAREWNPKLK